MTDDPEYAILSFDRALLPSGWAEKVLVSIDARGEIAEVQAGRPGTQRAVRIPGCALPGMPNLHSHAHQRAMAGLAEHAGASADSFWSWRSVMYDFVNRMTPEDLEAVAAQLYIEMLKSGYTAVAEFQYLHHAHDGRPYQEPAEMSLRCRAAARAAGIAMTSLPVLYRFGDFGAAPPRGAQRRFVNGADRYLAIVEALETDACGDPEHNVGLAPHSLRAVSGELLAEVLDGHRSPDGPVHIHIAEQSKEVDDCVAWSGQRPVRWLLSHFDVGPRWCLIHATHVNEEEVRDLALSGAVAGLCPTTEANLGDGVFPARALLSHGGRFGIGSDSQISISPVEELRWLEYGQRLIRQSRNVLCRDDGRSTGRSLFDAAVAGGARATGRNTGRIERGCRADMITLDTDHPLLHGRKGDALLDTWIFAGHVGLVRDVFVGGRQVVSNRAHAAQEGTALAFKQTLDRLLGGS